MAAAVATVLPVVPAGAADAGTITFSQASPFDYGSYVTATFTLAPGARLPRCTIAPPGGDLIDVADEASPFVIPTDAAGDGSVWCNVSTATGVEQAYADYSVVYTPSAAISALKADVNALVPAKTAKPLIALLDGAIKNLAKDDIDGAADKLTSFISQVNALAGKKIDAPDAATLVGEAQDIIDVIQPPPLAIDWANLQWPASVMLFTYSEMIYGQVWIDGVTFMPGQTPSLEADLGVSPVGTVPSDSSWVWVPAAFRGDAGNNDEFMAQLACADLPASSGTYQYLYRYTTDGGTTYTYGGLDGPVQADTATDRGGTLTANCEP